MNRRVLFWSVVLTGWWVQLCVVPARRLEIWRPELLLIMLTGVAMRSTLRRGALLGLLVGWLLVVCVPGHPSVLLMFCLLVGYGLGWLRTQWDTERFALSLAISWLVVMAWHGLSWCLKWGRDGAPRPWNLPFIVAQTSVTLAAASLWWRYAPRVRPHEN